MKKLLLCLAFITSAALGQAGAATTGAPKDTARSQSLRDTAMTVMERTFTYVERNGYHIGHTRSEVYSKFSITTNIRNILFRLLPNTVHIDRGKNTFFGESLTSVECCDFGISERKNLAFFCTLKKLKGLRNIYMSNISVQLYSPYIIGTSILSPFHSVNRRLYSYHTDPQPAQNGTETTLISFKPKYGSSLLIRGKAWIESRTGRIDSVRFATVYDNILHCDVGIKTCASGARSLLPQRVDIDARYKLAGNKVRLNSVSYVNHLHVDEKNYADSLRKVRGHAKHDISHLNIFSKDTTSTTRTALQFEKIRPVALTAREDSLRNAPQTGADSTQRIKRHTIFTEYSDSFENVFLDTHKFHLLNRRATISIPAVFSLSMLQWSARRGISLQKKFRFSYTGDNGVSLSLTPRIGYSLKQKQIYWQVPFKVTAFPKINGGFETRIGNGNRIYSSLQAREIRESMKNLSNYDSLLNVFNKFNFNYYNDLYVRSTFFFSPLCGLNVRVGTIFHQRELRNWNKEAHDSGLKRYYKSFAPRLEVSYTPGMYYYDNGNGRIPVKSYCPTFRGLYERGVKWMETDSRYDKFEFDCTYRIEIAKVRSLFLRGGCGFFTNRENMYFVDYDNFKFHNMPAGWDDDMSNEFHLLDRRFYNESNYYAMLSASYDAPLLVFGRMPLLSRAINRERIYLNTVSLHALTPYIEAGYGVSTNFFDGALFVGTGNATGTEFGAKISLRFFDRW